MISGIYIITTPSINNKCYIGSAINIRRRWHQHKSELIKNKHHNPYLQHVANKHGIEVFIFNTLLECSKETLIVNEQQALEKHKPEYNILKIAGSSFGRKCKEETKAKISAVLKGIPKSEETRIKMIAAHKGKGGGKVGRESGLKGRKRTKRTEEAKAKMSASHTGLKHSEETKAKMRISAKNRNHN